ncbi:MAG: hypothetical protein JSS83_08325 [Cyanobacteria bacterium SZAS LIN-3]|nr:hypothetical protein [Cyanobacteria bacterium SZAS LIN-3]
MSQTIPTEPKKKGNGVLRAMMDLFIILLLITGAGAGGYFWGIHQQLAPVLKVGIGTPGALPSPLPAPIGAGAAKAEPAPADKPGESKSGAEAKPAAAESHAPAAPAKNHSKAKFWIASSGSDYIGYSITVKVNGTPVDSFFGPGKIVDVSHLVKAGDNTLDIEAKQMGEQYNKHTGEEKYKLTLQLVSGEHISDSFKKSEVLQTYERSAADTDDATETLHFTGG